MQYIRQWSEVFSGRWRTPASVTFFIPEEVINSAKSFGKESHDKSADVFSVYIKIGVYITHPDYIINDNWLAGCLLLR